MQYKYRMLVFKKYLSIFFFFSFITISFAKQATIVTSFYPLYFLTKKIAPQEKILSLSNRDIHHFSPSPQNILTIQKADLFFYFSEHLEPWAKKAAENRKNTTVNIQKKITELYSKEDLHHDNDKEDLHHDNDKEDLHHDNDKKHLHHDNDKEDLHHDNDKKHLHHDNDKEDLHHDNDKEDLHHDNDKEHLHHDPHLWLDPLVMADITKLIEKELIKWNSKKKEIYNKNAEKLIKQFLEIHQEYKENIRGCQYEGFILTHNFLGHLAERYHFKTYNISGLSTLDEPSAKTILELKKLPLEKVAFILVEENSPSNFGNILLEQTKLQSLTIDNLTWKKEANYLTRLKNNLQSIKKALGCKN